MTSSAKGWTGVWRYENVRTLYSFMLANTCGRAIWDGQVFPAYVFLASGYSTTAVGFLAGVNGMTQLTVGPVVGCLSDMYDRAKILKCAAFIGLFAVFGTFAAIRTEGYEALIPCMLLWGGFNSSIGPTMDSLLADTTSEGERSQVYMYQTMIRQTGGVVGPVLSIVMFFYMGNTWELETCQLVISSGLVISLIAVVILFFVKSTVDTNDAAERSYEMVNLEESSSEGLADEKNDKDGDGDRDDEEQQTHEADTPTSIDRSRLVEDDGTASAVTNLDDKAHTQQVVQVMLQKDKNKEMARSRCPCLDVSYVAAMIAFSDIITGLASGMTIKFFPIFFIDVVGLKPVELSVLFMFVPLACSCMLYVNQHYTRKVLGRIWTPVILKAIGISCLLAICTLAIHMPDQKLVICILFVVRTGLMNSSKPLTKSIINDIVPKEQRGRWNSLETVNAATWSGSAALGGLLVDSYGFIPNFVATAVLQLSASIPLAMIAHLVTSESEV